MITTTSVLLYYVAIGMLMYVRLVSRFGKIGIQKFTTFMEKNLDTTGIPGARMESLTHVGLLISCLVSWPIWLTKLSLVFGTSDIQASLDRALSLAQTKIDKDK